MKYLKLFESFQNENFLNEYGLDFSVEIVDYLTEAGLDALDSGLGGEYREARDAGVEFHSDDEFCNELETTIGVKICPWDLNDSDEFPEPSALFSVHNYQTPGSAVLMATELETGETIEKDDTDIQKKPPRMMLEIRDANDRIISERDITEDMINNCFTKKKSSMYVDTYGKMKSNIQSFDPKFFEQLKKEILEKLAPLYLKDCLGLVDVVLKERPDLFELIKDNCGVVPSNILNKMKSEYPDLFENFS